MPLGYTTLLLAIGFAGSCLSVTLFATWLLSRGDRVMLTWSIGGVCIVLGVFVYSFYVVEPSRSIAALAAFVLLLVGLSLFCGGAVEFRLRRVATWEVAIVAVPALLIMLAGFATGYNGVGFIAANVAASGVLVVTAVHFWHARAQAPGPVLGIVVFHAAAAISFALCAAKLFVDNDFVLEAAPQNWAEDLNAVVGVIALVGVGALSLALNQSRLARLHRQASETDALTGLMNRRAIFDRYRDHTLAAGSGVVVFDLDGFKRINDGFGHSFGDEALRRFATALRRNMRAGDVAARLGGEEFALVVAPSGSTPAIEIAEEIRALFAFENIVGARGVVRCTVSAGVVVATPGQSFEDALLGADQALYRAKRNGRNRVVAEDLKLLT